MTDENFEYYKNWFEKVEKDWNRVEILLKANDTDGAAFHIQQALEKYLKIKPKILLILS